MATYFGLGGHGSVESAGFGEPSAVGAERGGAGKGAPFLV